MTEKKTKTETKKAKPKDPVAEWTKRIDAISKEKTRVIEHRGKQETELRRLTANRKAREQEVRELGERFFDAHYNHMSPGGLVDGLFKEDKGKIADSAQLELNIIAAQGAVQAAHKKLRELEAEEKQILHKLEEHAIKSHFKSFWGGFDRFERAIAEALKSVEYCKETASKLYSLDENWPSRLTRVDTPKELTHESKLGIERTSNFADAFRNPNTMASISLFSLLERFHRELPIGKMASKGNWERNFRDLGDRGLNP